VDKKVFSVHAFDPVDRRLVLTGCTILKGSDVSEILLGFMSYTT
jgi:hypothetical protein